MSYTFTQLYLHSHQIAMRCITYEQYVYLKANEKMQNKRKLKCAKYKVYVIIIIIIIIYPLTARVVGAPQMISQPVSSVYYVISYLLHDQR